MEAEEGEATKSYNNSLNFENILLAVGVGVVALLGYWCLSTVASSPQVVIGWFDGFRVFIRNIFYVFLFVHALVILSVYVSYRRTAEKHKPADLYDQYIAAVPTVVRPSPPKYNAYRVTEVEDDGDYYNNNSNYKEIVPASHAVKECKCCDRVVMEQGSPKSYRRTRSEKTMEKKSKVVEYRRMESERVSKTASWRSDSIGRLNSEDFRMTVETFITETKKTLLRENDAVDQWQNGAVNQWLNGDPQMQNGAIDQWQNGAVDQWRNGVPQLQWQNGVPQLQNSVPQLQNAVVQWLRSPDDGTGRRRHRSRKS